MNLFRIKYCLFNSLSLFCAVTGKCHTTPFALQHSLWLFITATTFFLSYVPWVTLHYCYGLLLADFGTSVLFFVGAAAITGVFITPIVAYFALGLMASSCAGSVAGV